MTTTPDFEAMAREAQRLSRMIFEHLGAVDDESEGNFARDIENSLRQTHNAAFEAAAVEADRHAAFCHKEAHHGGSHDLYERASGAAYLAVTYRALKVEE